MCILTPFSVHNHCPQRLGLQTDGCCFCRKIVRFPQKLGKEKSLQTPMFTGFLRTLVLYSPSRTRTYDNAVNSRALYHRYEYTPKDEDFYPCRKYLTTGFMISNCKTDCKHSFLFLANTFSATFPYSMPTFLPP